MRKTSKVMFGLLATSVLGLSACSKGPSVPDDPKAPEMGCYTYMDYTTISPSNWNALTYKDNNDTQIMSFIGGSFFTFNYAFDANGDVIEGDFAIEYDGAKALQDVTGSYVDYSDIGGPKMSDFDNSIPSTQDDDGDGTPDRITADGDGYAYKITLREDLKWDDGTAIKADDFVYSMKEQLNPLFLNYRADSFYVGSLILHNAKEYVKQGQSGVFAASTAYGANYTPDLDSKVTFASYTDASRVENSALVNGFVKNNPSYAKYFGKTFVNDAGETKDGYGVFLIPYLYSASFVSSVAEATEFSKKMDGKTLAQIKADDELSELLENLRNWWETDPSTYNEYLDYYVCDYAYPELSFDKVGIFKGDTDYELIIVLDKSLKLLKPDGSLGYKAAYNLGDLPLVKRDLYEANKHEPTTEGGLWTSTYNSSADSTASWGPYKLSSFIAGQQYILERNTNWYGYNMDEYKGQYQTDRIVCNTIGEWQTAWLSFQKGNLTTIGIDVSIAEDYKNSSRATFRASDFISSLQLQSNAEALAGRETAGVDKEMLNYVDFRKALSLAINRDDYAKKTTTAFQAGLGIFNSMHYFDVENGAAGVYRNTDDAKIALCNVYGVDPDDYDDLDAAVAAIGNGQNLDLARELLDKAYDEALAAGTISATDRVVLTVGAEEDNEANRRSFNYLKDAVELLAQGTKLAGKLTLDFSAEFGAQWAEDFRAGAYDICTGGWSGAALDPGYFLLAYLGDDYRYAQGWDPSTVTVDYNPFKDGDPDHIYSLTLPEWYDLLNGDFAEGKLDANLRCGIIAAMEQAILETYYVCPMMNGYGASLLSYKVENFQKTYNTFMGFGGIRYMTYRYDDLAWAYIKTLFDYKN